MKYIICIDEIFLKLFLVINYDYQKKDPWFYYRTPNKLNKINFNVGERNNIKNYETSTNKKFTLKIQDLKSPMKTSFIFKKSSY